MNDAAHQPLGAAPSPTVGPPRVGWPVWAAGGAVAAGAGAATAHGLYEVAAAAGVPAGLAWLYPLITDGLALVAYAATTRLAGGGARYAWSVVVLAAGLSGLAQAAYLASDPAAPGGPGALLRFGIGAWPAIAAAITAHLLYLLATPTSAVDTTPSRRPTRSAAEGTTVRALPVNDGPSGVHAPAVGARLSREHPGTVHARIPTCTPTPGDTESSPTVHARPAPADPVTGADPGAAVPAGQPPPALRERARDAADAYRAETGAWPSVRALAAAAQVSEGLAAKTLRHLRTQNDTSPSPDQITETPETTP